MIGYRPHMSASRDLLKTILPLGPGSTLLPNEDIPFPIALQNADGTDRYVPKTERGAIFIRRFLVGRSVNPTFHRQRREALLPWISDSPTWAACPSTTATPLPVSLSP
jgi:hypothetical protein